jgi:hypothetical protein
MSKSHLDRVLENAVAKALELTPPHKLPRRMIRLERTSHIKHAA